MVPLPRSDRSSAAIRIGHVNKARTRVGADGEINTKTSTELPPENTHYVKVSSHHSLERIHGISTIRFNPKLDRELCPGIEARGVGNLNETADTVETERLTRFTGRKASAPPERAVVGTHFI